jgi:GntR family transcriptional regulator/MocR family aminotransferase
MNWFSAKVHFREKSLNQLGGPVDLLLELRRGNGRSLRAQLEEALRAAIREGRLGAGARLPSSRALAADLGVARGLVVEAYAQLAAEGWVVSRAGSGTRVAEATAAGQPVRPRGDLLPAGWWERRGHPDAGGRALRYDFRPGVPDLAAFPRAAWQAALKRSVQTLAAADLSYGDPRGLGALRAALAAYLRRVRGVVADPEQVIVCGGFAQGLGLACRVLGVRGVTRLALEDPGSPGMAAIAITAGVQPVGVPVDARGMVPEALEGTGAGAVAVMPAHQFPTGAVLAPDRRAALLAWAREQGALVIEDDYDAEFRYDREPVGSLQGRAPERVLYGGSVSKTLAPGLRLGWMVAPAELVGPLASAKLNADLGSPALDQAALAHLIGSGAYDRHLRRVRRRYWSRRDALVAALAEHLPEAKVSGAAAGLHALVELPPGTDEDALVAEAARRDVRVYGLRGYRGAPDGSAPDGEPAALVLGYGHLSEHELTEGVTRLAAAAQA